MSGSSAAKRCIMRVAGSSGDIIHRQSAAAKVARCELNQTASRCRPKMKIRHQTATQHRQRCCHEIQTTRGIKLADLSRMTRTNYNPEKRSQRANSTNNTLFTSERITRGSFKVQIQHFKAAFITFWDKNSFNVMKINQING